MSGPRIDRSKYSYDPETGIITGASFRVNKRTGYLDTEINGRKVMAHKLAWYLHYGYWPPRLDHEDRDKLNNRIKNLRIADKFQNAQNRKHFTRYLSRCIYYDLSHPSPKKYRVRVQANGTRKHIGWYHTEEEARDAAIAAIKSAHGDFACLD